MAVLDDLQLDLTHLLQLAPAGYHIGLHYRFAGPVFMFQTHDVAWLQTYMERGLAQQDPIMAWALSRTGYMRWDGLAEDDPSGMLTIAANHGLHFGVVMSLGTPTSRTVASFARADRNFSDAEITTIHSSVQRMHLATMPPERLTRALADALRCVSDGDRLAIAAERLGITERAMKARLLAARTKLGARTTAEAVQKAKLYRLI
jgi:LuxR family transcriptional regulator, quorum-sensing system regulator SdiA